MMRPLIALVFLCGCKTEHSAGIDAGQPPAPFTQVLIDRSRILMLELHGEDFEEARGRSCQLEAIVEVPDAGSYPVLRFKCQAAFAGP